MVKQHCCPRWLGVISRQQPSRDRGLFLQLALDSACTNPSPKGPSCSTDSFLRSSMTSTSPNSAKAFPPSAPHVRTPDHCHRHPRRHGSPSARFCFALALCAAIFKPTVTWKRNRTAIVVGDHSSAVKRFIFVKRVLYSKTASASQWLS